MIFLKTDEEIETVGDEIGQPYFAQLNADLKAADEIVEWLLN